MLIMYHTLLKYPLISEYHSKINNLRICDKLLTKRQKRNYDQVSTKLTQFRTLVYQRNNYFELDLL